LTPPNTLVAWRLVAQRNTDRVQYKPSTCGQCPIRLGPWGGYSPQNQHWGWRRVYV